MKRLGIQLCSIFLLGLSALLCSPQAAQGQVAAPVAAMTIGAFLNGLKGLVQQLEQSASALMSQGNNSLAQQQLILAGTIQGTINQVTASYADSLDKTFGQLNTAEMNAFSDVATTVNQLTNLEGKTSGDVQTLVYKTQGAANQLLDRIPLTNRTPVFYGVSVRDMVADPAQSPSDIEILGFAFEDPKLNSKKPVVKVAGKTLADTSVSVQQDRIQVQIPDDLKREIGFSAGPCNPRKTFPIDMQVFYSGSFLFGLFHPEKTSSFHANALPGIQAYTVVVSYSGVRTETTQTPQTFAVPSGSINVGCQQGASTSVTYNLPANAIPGPCNSGWINTSNLQRQDQTACVITGQTASASGNIYGLNNQCFMGICNCPGGGHGQLQIAGSYTVPVTATTNVNNAAGGSYTLSQGIVSATLPADTALKLNGISIAITRKGCSTAVDTINLSLQNNPLQAITQTSSEGQFEATFRQGQVSITRKK